MSRKPETLHERRIIVYNKEHWERFDDLRNRTLRVLSDLRDAGLESYVYGSVARGDISKGSDIDIVLLNMVPSYRVELALGKVFDRELVQATPSSVLKGHLYLDDQIVVSFPLFKMMSREREFYQWGGMAGVQDVLANKRRPGVDKRLILIEPTEVGHIEHGVIGYEWHTAKVLGVGLDIAQERIRVLQRRDAVGRTGVYRTYHLGDDETFEEAARSLVDTDPALRRTIRRRE